MYNFPSLETSDNSNGIFRKDQVQMFYVSLLFLLEMYISSVATIVFYSAWCNQEKV